MRLNQPVERADAPQPIRWQRQAFAIVGSWSAGSFLEEES
jgi:hypothetical protein